MLDLIRSFIISFQRKTTTKQALFDPNWKYVKKDEYDAFIKNQTWVLVPRPPDINIIRCMWILNIKWNLSFERYKVRLVGDGRPQKVGVGCDGTFKPAISQTVLIIALSKLWPIHQLDVQNVFLHGNLRETVYMYQPMDFRDPSFPYDVCHLKKSLYDLKQAPHAWYRQFAEFVFTISYHIKSDHSLFSYHNTNHMAYILL
jgi:histone deacetylase 1/2